MKHFLWGAIIVIALYLLDRIAPWTEARGWIYYRKRRAGGGAIGNAFLEIQSFLEPSKRHIPEERLKKGGAAQESGDKPKPGGPKVNSAGKS